MMEPVSNYMEREEQVEWEMKEVGEGDVCTKSSFCDKLNKMRKYRTLFFVYSKN